MNDYNLIGQTLYHLILKIMMEPKWHFRFILSVIIAE
jgi:hypothetical protein